MTSPRFHDRDTRAIEQFVAIDAFSAVVGLVLLITGNVLFIQSTTLWVIVPFLVLLLATLLAAGRLVTRNGSILVALLLIIIGNWAIDLAVSVVVPFMWPVMAVGILVPLVLAIPFLERSELLAIGVTASLAAGAVATLGILNYDRFVYPELEGSAELLIVIATLLMEIVPIGLIVWQNHRLQHENLDRANDLNEQLARSEAALAASRRRVVHASDSERRRVLIELHDGAQQSLLAAGIRLRLLERETSHLVEFQEPVEAVIGDLDAAIENVRNLAQSIYPPLLQSEGLVGALGEAARGSTVPVRLRLEDISRLNPSVETALYFTALEALTNAAQHAPSSTVDLALITEGSSLRLSVVDDGPGFIIDEWMEARVTQRMGDRVAAVGGDLSITSTVGVGTTVMATVPRSEASVG